MGFPLTRLDAVLSEAEELDKKFQGFRSLIEMIVEMETNNSKRTALDILSKLRGALTDFPLPRTSAIIAERTLLSKNFRHNEKVRLYKARKKMKEIEKEKESFKLG